MITTLNISELKTGMFVLDVTWVEKLFKVKTQGLVRTEKAIEQLKQHGVLKVTVDQTLANNPQASTLKLTKLSPISNNEQKDLTEEFAKSCSIYDNATSDIKKAFIRLGSGGSLNSASMTQLAGEITDSVIRNEYSMSILTRIRNKSTYQWEHSINCAVIMCGFSLYLGLQKDVVKQITLGALLHDVGVAKVSKGILYKPSKLTKNDKDVIEKHVMWGYNICKSEGISNKIITDMVVNHHERLDGSGYPRQMDEKNLSKLARMIAIVDVYDAMTGDKPYKSAEEPINVFRYLMTKNNLFDRMLVQQFIKYMGVHPVGTLVKLSNERLAVIIEGNRVDPLKPVVKVIYNLKQNLNLTPRECNLAKENINIISAVNAEDYQINLSKIIRNII